MKKNNKRNLIILGSLATLTLASVGFATWIVGVQQLSKDNDLKLNVDTVKNNSIMLDASLSDNTVTIAESEETADNASNIITAKKNAEGSAVQVDENALTFAFESITFKIGKGNDAAVLPTSININLLENENNKVLAEGEKIIDKMNGENKVTEYKRKAAAPWTYVEYSETLDISFKEGSQIERNNCTVKDDGNFYTYTVDLTKVNQKLSWGTFFRDEVDAQKTSPVTFYNNKFKAETDFNFKFDEANHVAEELTAMKTALTNTFTLQLAFNTAK